MNRRLGLVAVAVSSMCYGTLAFFGKQLTAAGIGVTTLLFWRFFIGAMTLSLIAVALRARVPQRADALKILGLGCFFAGMSLTYFIALTRAGAAYAVLTLYAYPAVVAVVEHVFGNRIDSRRAATLCLALCGIALLVHPGGRVDAWGIGAGLMSALFYGFYLVTTSRVMVRVPALTGSLGIVAVMVIVFGCVNLSSGAHGIPRALLPLTIVFGILSTAIPIALLSYGIPRIGAPRAAVLGTLEPLTAIVLVTAFAGERLDALQWAGGALLVLSSIVPDRPQVAPLEG